jgi:hypothetical protein
MATAVFQMHLKESVGMGLKAIKTIREVPKAFRDATLRRRRLDPDAGGPLEAVELRGQCYKLACADWPLTDELLAKLPAFQARLAKDDIFITDIDIKIDMAGTTQPREAVEEYLRRVDRVQLQRDVSESNSSDRSKMLLLDNRDKVGPNCFTFLTFEGENVISRIKLYGKFQQMVECHTDAGCHLHEWVDQKGTQLRTYGDRGVPGGRIVPARDHTLQ